MHKCQSFILIFFNIYVNFLGKCELNRLKISAFQKIYFVVSCLQIEFIFFTI